MGSSCAIIPQTAGLWLEGLGEEGIWHNLNILLLLFNDVGVMGMDFEPGTPASQSSYSQVCCPSSVFTVIFTVTHYPTLRDLKTKKLLRMLR